MKVSQLVGTRKKENPSECQTANHIFSIRGGYIRQVSSGVFSLYNPMRRITQKIEAIIRQEMDRIDGQEVLFPVVMPASIWQESGRYDSIGSEMLRFTDRNGSKNVLGMTHEEAAVHLTRDVAASYQNYPFMIYQIQTKFRDEPRCRGGLVRVREFTMKDAYSFHTDWDDLRQYYQVCFDAYNRIFKRVGMPEVVAVESDSGMMGGSLSHEFMFLSDIGEDRIVSCPHCGYLANQEVTETIVEATEGEETGLEKIHTPNVKTIQGLCKTLKLSEDQFMKAVVYQQNDDDSLVVAFIRGDLDINETKLRNHLGTEVHPAANLDPACGLTVGFIGALGLSEKFKCVFDRSLQGVKSLYGGANEEDYHVSGISMPRDFPNAQFVDVAKAVNGGICPECKEAGLVLSNGVEVGNIFQLGDKYSKSMKMQYLDRDGALQYPVMCSYGIGVGRLAASICEAHHDKFGPIWPASVAPWQVQLCALNVTTDNIRPAADELYKALKQAGVEVIYDDREVSAGVMFSEADLLGCPLRIIISPKTVARGCVELFSRDKSLKADLPLDTAAIVAEVQAQLKLQLDSFLD